MQKWEYKIVYAPDEKQLNELGEQGWELIAVTFDGYGLLKDFYFKRPKQ